MRGKVWQLFHRSAMNQEQAHAKQRQILFLPWGTSKFPCHRPCQHRGWSVIPPIGTLLREESKRGMISFLYHCRSILPLFYPLTRHFHPPCSRVLVNSSDFGASESSSMDEYSCQGQCTPQSSLSLPGHRCDTQREPTLIHDPRRNHWIAAEGMLNVCAVQSICILAGIC